MHIAARVFWLAVLLVAGGCATSPESGAITRRPFDFQADTFSYSNELVWEYAFDPATQQTTTTKREPPQTYTHRCFVVVRAARQFFNHARFDPTVPPATNYLPIVRKVLARSPRKESADAEKIIIPGYRNLRAFSGDHAPLLQSHCGGPWESYFQRGHWRMLFPLTRKHQKRTAEQLIAQLRDKRAPIVHIVRFPSLAINHVLLIYTAERNADETRFLAYDPNDPHVPTPLTYKDGRFSIPANPYFPRGGRVDIYPIFTGLLY